MLFRSPPSSHFPQLKFRTRILISDMWWRVNLHLQNSSRYVLFGFSDDNILSTLSLFCLFEACFVFSKPFLHNISRNITHFTYFYNFGEKEKGLCACARLRDVFADSKSIKIHKNLGPGIGKSSGDKEVACDPRICCNIHPLASTP